MPKQPPTKHRSRPLRVAMSGVLLVVAVYLLATHWHTVLSSVQAARGASIPWLVLSLLLMTLTFCIAAVIYGLLAFRPLRYGQTLLVQVSTAFVNRLLPSGLGSLGLNGVYLYKRGHTAAEATVVVGVNNLLGIAGHFLLLGCVSLAYPAVWRQLDLGKNHLGSWHVLLAVVAVLLIVIALPPVRRRIVAFVQGLLVSLYKFKLRQIACALLLALTFTATYILILLATARSVGIQLGILQLFIVFSIGMLTSTATPTPGGLVGAEAGLFAGFVAYGISSPVAGAAVLLYRLTTYWLPLIPGVFALLIARSRKLI